MACTEQDRHLNPGQSPALPAARHTTPSLKQLVACGVADKPFHSSAGSAPRASPRLWSHSGAVLPGGCREPRAEVLTLLEGL